AVSFQIIGPLTAGAFTPPPAIEGLPIVNFTAFHFTDANAFARSEEHRVGVDWGDGTPETILTSSASSAGQIVANPGGGFDVQISHAYQDELTNATFPVTVEEKDGGVTPIQGSTDSFVVADAPLTAGAFTPPLATKGVPITNFTAFHFTDANPFATIAEYTATVQWGDGTSSVLTGNPSVNGQIVANPGGGFDV